MRYDRWKDDSAAAMQRARRLYWRTVAGLHTEFADVLTYLYDSAHANHVHIDIGRFGPEGAPRLIERSRAQVQCVQAISRYVWNRTEVELTGDYDTITRDATTAVLADHGGGELHQGSEAWRAFMVASLGNS